MICAVQTHHANPTVRRNLPRPAHSVEEIIQGMSSQRKGRLGAILEAAYHRGITVMKLPCTDWSALRETCDKLLCQAGYPSVAAARPALIKGDVQGPIEEHLNGQGGKLTNGQGGKLTGMYNGSSCLPNMGTLIVTVNTLW